MQRVFMVLLFLALLISACAGPAEEKVSTQIEALIISGGSTEKSYTLADLQALETSQAAFKDVSYIGVPLAVLLQDAGFDPQAVKAVKAVAVDGFSANYEPELVNRPDTLLAYARADGPLAEDEGQFRMVLPDQEGRFNVRQLSEIQVIP